MYADTRLWVRKGWVDYIAPQLYWSMGDKAASYRTLVRWWAGVAGEAPKGTPVRLFIGQAAYRVKKSSADPAFRSGTELTRHLTENAKYPQVDGDIYFSARDLAADRRGMARDLADGPYRHPALPPAMSRAPGGDPAAVTGLKASRAGGGVRLSWSPVRGATAYAVYRFGKTPGRCGLADARHLVAVVRGTAYDDKAERGHYYVTALTRTSRESPTGTATTVH